MSAYLVELAPPTLFSIGPVPVTNTLLAALVADLCLILLALTLRRNLAVVPGRLQTFLEGILDFYMEQLTKATGSEKLARRAFPVIFTLFLFLIFANQFGLIPILGMFIVGEEGTALFRTPTTDYSLTIASALLVLGLSHVLAFTLAPIQHVGNFFKIAPILRARSIRDFMMSGIDFCLGLLDIVGEIAKVISLSTRLFGNIFAGEVIIGIISSLFFFTQFIIPLPFLFLSTASSFVQAFLLPFLGILFMANTLSSLPKPQEA